MASFRSAWSASLRAAARSLSIRRRSAATSIPAAVSSSTVMPSASTDAVAVKPSPGAVSRSSDRMLVSCGARRALDPGEQRGDLLPGPQALIGTEPADLGDQPHQRADLRFGAPGRGRPPGRPQPDGRWPGHGATMMVSPPVSAVHSSSVTNGMTGWSSLSSRSST